MKLKIKKGDTVEVITGSDKGKRGAVLAIDRTAMKIKVQGVRMQTHFSRQDGKQEKEGFLSYSNVKLIEKAAASNKKKAKKKATVSK